MSDEKQIDFPTEETKRSKAKAGPKPPAKTEKPPADPDKFHGQKLFPFSGARRIVASKMGMRILSAGEDTWMAFQTRGLYDQILADACLCVWICLQPQTAIVRALHNSSKAAAEFGEWLDKHNWHTYDASLQGSFSHLIGPMLEQVKDGACAIMIEEDPCPITIGAQTFTGNYEAATGEDGTVTHNITLTNADADPLGIAIGDEINVETGDFRVVEIDRLKLHSIYTVEEYLY